ncbi:MAG: mechanosensitive ion channel [Desulfobacterales bacterium]
MNNSEKIAELFKSLNSQVILKAVLIFVAAWLLVVLSQRFLRFLAEKFSGQRRHFILASVSVLRLVIIFTAIVLVIPILVEPSFENLFALMGALGIMLGFAFKDYTSSLIAGIVTLFEMPYRPGDWIEIEGNYGEVKKIDMRCAEIITPDDTVVTVPHLKLWDGLIANSNDGTRSLMCVVDYYLLPNHDALKVKNTLYDVALTSVYLQLQRPIVVIIQEKPFGTHYQLKAYPNDPRDQFFFITDLTVRGKSALLDLGVKYAPVFPVPSNPSI